MIETYQKKDGTWSYRARMMIGSRFFYSLWCDNRREAETWEAETRVKVNSGQIIVGGKQKFKDFAMEWLEHQQANTVKGSWVKERANLTRHLLPVFGEREMRSFNLKDVQKWFNDLGKKPAEPATPEPILRSKRNGKKLRPRRHPTENKRDDLIRCMKQIFAKAAEWGVISADPLSALPRLSLQKKRTEKFNDDELAKMMPWLFDNQPEVADLAIFAVNTGIRLGELVAIKWSDIDFRSRAVMIETQWDAKELEFVDRTKGKEVRQVPLNHECIQILQELKLRPRPDGRVFTDDYYHITRDFTGWMTSMGLEAALARGCTFYNLRHTFSSNFLSDPNNTMYDLQKILGHKSITTTEKNYLCFDPRHLRGKTDNTGFSFSRQRAKVLSMQK